MLRTLVSNRRVIVGTCGMLILFAGALFAPFVAPHNPDKMRPEMAFHSPCTEFPFGTDDYGRDILSRLIFGARTSIQIAVFAVLIATVCGVSLGTVSAYWGGVADQIIMRTMDMLISIPPVLFAIALVAFLGTGVPYLILAIAVLYTPRFARIAYSSSLSIKESDFVQASQAIGSSHLRIVCTDILPNIMAPVIILASLSLGRAILLESGLSFLGLGPPPPTPTWGNMLSKARELMDVRPVLIIWPSIAVAAAVLIFNTIGDGLRDALDPRLKI